MKCLLVLVLISICEGRPADDTDAMTICTNGKEEEVPCAYDFDEDGVQVRAEEPASVDQIVTICHNDKDEVVGCADPDDMEADGKTVPVDITCHNDDGDEVDCNVECNEGDINCEQSQAKHIDPAECKNDAGEIVPCRQERPVLDECRNDEGKLVDCCIDEDTSEVIACVAERLVAEEICTNIDGDVVPCAEEMCTTWWGDVVPCVETSDDEIGETDDTSQ